MLLFLMVNNNIKLRCSLPEHNKTQNKHRQWAKEALLKALTNLGMQWNDRFVAFGKNLFVSEKVSKKSNQIYLFIVYLLTK